MASNHSTSMAEPKAPQTQDKIEDQVDDGDDGEDDVDPATPAGTGGL